MSEESLLREYDIYFKRFYNELHKYNEYIGINQNHKKLKCTGCKTKKKLIINSDKNELTYSCGPLRNKDKKCGFQFSIDLPEYINFREYEKLYKNRINGSTEYDKLLKKQILEYDLDTLSKYINVNSEFSERKEIIDFASESLKKLYDDYIKLNNLTVHIQNIKELYQKRNKNSFEKKKIMKKILDNDLPEEEKHVERKKYAVLIRENKEFINIITELRSENINYIMIKSPAINGDIKEEINIKEDSSLIDGILQTFKQNNGILSRDDYQDLIKRLNKKTEWSQLLFVSLQKEHKNSWKSDLQEIHGSIIKKPSHSSNPEYIELSDNWKQLLLSDDNEIKNKTTFEEQVRLLIQFYKKVDSSKNDDDVRKIINNRRPKDTQFNIRIPTKDWLELCDKLETKYKIHPLRMEQNISVEDPNDEDYVWPESGGWNTPKKKV